MKQLSPFLTTDHCAKAAKVLRGYAQDDAEIPELHDQQIELAQKIEKVASEEKSLESLLPSYREIERLAVGCVWFGLIEEALAEINARQSA